MQLVVSPATKQQNDLLGAFLRQLEGAKRNMQELASSYKACVDAGIDLSRYVSRSMAFRLIELANGKLHPEVSNRLLANDTMTIVMTMLPIDMQATLLERGVEVSRKGEATTVPIDDVRPGEARRLLDVTGGRPRLLSAKEQAARQAPIPRRADKQETIRFTPEEYYVLEQAAKKAQRSIPHYIKQQLYLAGILDPKAKK